jgi:ribonuclease D
MKAATSSDRSAADPMTLRHHKGDLPDLSLYGDRVAVDTETLGLSLTRDRLCVVQLSPGDGSADIVQIAPGQREAPNLCALLSDNRRIKIFHYARFDIAFLFKTFGVMTSRVYCTKIASKLTRTYTDRHGLKDLVKDLLDIDLSKQQQSSDWAAETLSDAQIAYAASDVLYLHAIKAELDRRLVRERRADLAEACFGFLPARALLDLSGWEDDDIFAH